jgi:ubiquilin
MMQQMMQANPVMQQTLANPDFLRLMMDPANMRAMAQIQEGMAQLQRSGLMRHLSGGDGGMPGAAGVGAGGFDPSVLASMFGGAGSTTGPGAAGGFDPSMFSSMVGGAPGATGATGATAEPAVEPRVRLATQLQQLKDMGFGDETANLAALQSTNGNVDAAIEVRRCGFRGEYRQRCVFLSFFCS